MGNIRIVTRSDLTSVADVLRITPGKKLVFPTEFISADEELRNKSTDFDLFITGILESFKSNNVEEIGPWSLAYQDNLKFIELPGLKTVGQHGCCYCHRLEAVDLGMATQINHNAFYGCFNLKTLIIRSDTVCTLSASQNLEMTPFHFNKQPEGNDLTNYGYIPAGGGFILCPEGLDYTNATNWGSLSKGFKILPLKTYTVDGTINGSINWEKLRNDGHEAAIPSTIKVTLPEREAAE